MKRRYRLYFRHKTGRYYAHDGLTGKQDSLHTKDRATAIRLLHSRNEAEQQPAVNLQIARAYLAATDKEISTRSWQYVMEEIVKLKTGEETRRRWLIAIKDKSFDTIRHLPVLQTRPEQFLRVLETGKVSTNVYLRRIHNFALDMSWLPWPVIPKRQWPKVEYGEKRAITAEEHRQIVEREQNPERKAFYQLAWHLGASQSDLAHLQAEDVNWQTRMICFVRMKLRKRNLVPPQIRFGHEVEAILATLPANGPLLPYLATVRASDRATEFKQRCAGLSIKGVTLHSYRYAWAERAKKAGYPERYAQINLGHNSKAYARAYSKNAEVTLPSLEEYEQKIVQLPTLSRPEASHETHAVNR